MVANAIGRPPAPTPLNTDDDALEPGLRENLTRQLRPLLDRLKNRWVLLLLFLAAYLPFGLIYMQAYQDHTALQGRINAQEAVLALPEPRTDDIEQGLRSWTAALRAANDAQILELEDSTLIEQLIATANSTGLTIQSMSTSANTIVPVGAEAYDVTPFILRVSGEIAAIESFMALLEGDAVEALEIQNSLVSPQEEGDFAAVIRAIVFNRPVDPSLLTEEEQIELSRRVTDEELDAAAAGISPGGAR